MDLESHRFITYFEPEQANLICQQAVVETYPDRHIIFEEGEIPDYLYLVLSGQVEFCKHTVMDQYQLVAIAEPNEFFGEFGVLDGQPRSTRAITNGESSLAKIPRDKLMEILHLTTGGAVVQMFRHIIQHIRSTTEQYVNEVVYKQKMVAVGEMVNTIVHDFKSPFTGITLASSMLKELHSDDEETGEWCDLIQAQVTHMLTMAEELLEFTRGNTKLHKHPVNIASLFQQIEKLNRIYFTDAKVDLQVTAEEVLVNGDENKLLRVFQNLVGNAVDAFGGRGGQIKIEVRSQDTWADINISDNGPGIPEEIRDRLFEAFVTYGKRGGTGLGTAIAKSIIDAHGGKIDFESYLGKGTTFYIRLPLLRE